VGRVSDTSDAVVAALLAMPLDDDLVAPVLVAGLRRLLFLCRGSRRELLDDLVVELAIAIGELRRVRPLVFRRRLAYVIVDRARDRQRAALRRERAWRPVDALGVAELLESGDAGVEEAAVDRVRLGVVRDQIVAAGDVALARSWNSLVELMDSPRESQAERDRWKYVRRRLAGHLGPDAA
ncbi:MAG TPA: hypothetical protein PLV68_01495, partial [Ilumatobacteraceae bacterium]|nr:hypothetical protein [Ilumatobacteraceae bacterium]